MLRAFRPVVRLVAPAGAGPNPAIARRALAHRALVRRPALPRSLLLALVPIVPAGALWQQKQERLQRQRWRARQQRVAQAASARTRAALATSPAGASHRLERRNPAWRSLAQGAAESARRWAVELGRCLADAARLLQLALLFAPAALAYPLLHLLPRAAAPPGQAAAAPAEGRAAEGWWAGGLVGFEAMHARWCALVAATLQRAGPTFVKLGQWASTRPDIFSGALCGALGAQLHSAVATEHPSLTRRTLEEAFGGAAALAARFETVELGAALGSGCVAQVHRAVLRRRAAAGGHRQEGEGEGEGAEHREVVLKVRRHGVADAVARDVRLLRRCAAALVALSPRALGLEWLSLEAGAAHFEGFLLGQLDLRREADNLRRFGQHFGGARDIAFPRVVELCMALAPGEAEEAASRGGGGGGGDTGPTVIVESLEVGVPMGRVLQEQGAGVGGAAGVVYRRQVGHTLCQRFFEMVLVHNFVHCDMHPGNILVRDEEEEGQGGSGGGRPVCVVLDPGLAVELPEADRANFLDLFCAVAEGDGRRAGRLMWDRSQRRGAEDPGAFLDGMEDLVRRWVGDRAAAPAAGAAGGGCGGVAAEAAAASASASPAPASFNLAAVEIGSVLREVLDLVRTHRVQVDPSFTSLVTSIVIVEGIGRQLVPDLNLFALAMPMVLRAQPEYRRGMVKGASAALWAASRT
jgi:aarF domain-containing kinase